MKTVRVIISGVYIYTTESWTQKQISAAAEQARDYPDVIDAIFVGNENVFYDGTGDNTADELVDYIDDLRTYLESYNVG